MSLGHLSNLSMAFGCSPEITDSGSTQLVSVFEFFLGSSHSVGLTWVVHPLSGSVFVIICFFLDVHWNSVINGLFPWAWSPASEISEIGIVLFTNSEFCSRCGGLLFVYIEKID